MRKSLLAAACVVGLAATAMAAKTVTIEVVGGSGKVMVNGQPYVPGTPVKAGAKITVEGSVTMKVGGVTIKTDGATLRVTGNAVRVLSGTAQVTNAAGATQTVAKGDSVAVATVEAAPAAAAAAAVEAAAETTVTLPPAPPPPTAAEAVQSGVSGGK